MPGGLYRAGAFLIIAGDIRQPCGEAAAAASRAALRSDDPTAQLNRFLPCQRDGKGRIGSIEQMVSLIENDPRGPVASPPPSRRNHHDPRVIGDNATSTTASPTAP